MSGYEYKDTTSCNIIVNNQGLYKFNLGPRIISYNCNETKSYDHRNNQLFIQNKSHRLFLDKFLDKM